jgi:hypothetical protein
LVVILTIASLLGQLYKYSGGHDRYLVTLFDLDKEWNIPTLYSSMSLLFCSFLLAIISSAKKMEKADFTFQWALLAAIFLLLSIDETIQLHEQTITPLRLLFHGRGIFYFSWVIPALAFLFFLGLAYLKFFFALSKRMRLLFFVSGLLYVGGALGMELVGGYYAQLHGQNNIGYALLANFEEVLEMTGVLVFLYTLMSIIRSEFRDLSIQLA